jgi:hypothetical protein
MTAHDLTQIWYPSFDGMHLSLWHSQQLGTAMLLAGLVVLAWRLVWWQFHPKH